jgi:uncharacterized lipoprotein YmbA
MKKYLFVMAVAMFMTGCASKEYKGNGEYFQLQDRHVIYRDLTRPFGVNNAGDLETNISTPGALPR